MNDQSKLAIAGLGILTLGVYLFMTRRKMTAEGEAAVANPDAFASALPSQAKPYASIILQAANETNVDPFLIAAVGWRESRWGDALDANLLGDGGHGHGLMQIDNRTWASWIATYDWTDPYTNVRKGAEILGSNLDYFTGKGLAGTELLQAAAAAYNHGPGNVWSNIKAGNSIDTGTANGNYGSDVVATMIGYAASAGIA